MHSAFFFQSFGDACVPLRPGAPFSARREALAISGVVATAGLAVDPAMA
jgi:hypothetical protein